MFVACAKAAIPWTRSLLVTPGIRTCGMLVGLAHSEQISTDAELSVRQYQRVAAGAFRASASESGLAIVSCKGPVRCGQPNPPGDESPRAQGRQHP